MNRGTQQGMHGVVVLAVAVLAVYGCSSGRTPSTDGDVTEQDVENADLDGGETAELADSTEHGTDGEDSPSEINEAETAENDQETTPEQEISVEEDLTTDQETAEQDMAEQDTSQGPPGHTELNGGIPHKPGKADPMSNCTSCHGSDLSGGSSGQSCYACHNNSDHTINQQGTKHFDGSRSSCTACHGPNNTGGLGPACTSCHRH